MPVYPSEVWLSDTAVEALDGTTDVGTGLPYIPKGTGPTSSPSLEVQYNRRLYRENMILAAAAEGRVVKGGDTHIGCFACYYRLGGTDYHYPGEVSVEVSANGVHLVYLDSGSDENSNGLMQVVTEGTGWPTDQATFIPLAKVAVANGAISTIVDVRNLIRLAADALNDQSITDGAVSTAKLADGAVTTVKLGDASVSTNKLIDGSVTSAKILDGSISAGDLADGLVTTAKIAAGAVGTNELAADSVTGAKIATGAVDTDQLAADAITTSKLADDAVSAAKIGDGAVTVDKIGSSAVSSTKLATSSVTASKILDGVVSESKLAFVPVVCEKHTIAYSDLTASSGQQSITLFTCNDPGVVIERVVVKHTTAFSGGSITALTVAVGKALDSEYYCSPHDIYQSVAPQVHKLSTTQDMESDSDAVKAQFSATGGNVNTLTAGSVDIYVWTTTLG